MKNFNVATETKVVEKFNFGSDAQVEKATELKAVRAFKLDRHLLALPAYIVKACADAGYQVARVGGTTYKNSYWVLY